MKRTIAETMSQSWKVVNVLVLGVLLVGMLYFPALAAPTRTPTGERLRDLAGSSFLIGTATENNFWNLSDAAEYQAVIQSEFNILTSGNQMKWDTIHPAATTYNFSPADQFVQFSETNDIKVHGHTLLWHSQLPSWVTGGTWTAATLTSAMYDHIDTVVGHFKGKIAVWDVVNEGFNEDGTYRTTLWYNTIGQQYLELAFARARAADPAAKLIYNDYNIETVNSKSTAVYNMLVDFKNRGIPVDGVGFQMHLLNSGLDYQSLATNMQRFAALGLEVYITEMDVRFPLPMSATDLTTQATIYRNVADRCLAQPACKALQVWGFTDKYSWIPSFFPGYGDALIFDSSYQPKEAYYALQAALIAGIARTPTPTLTGTQPTPTITRTRTPTNTPVPGSCKVAYTKNQWSNGFTAEIKVTNNSTAALNGWTLTWNYVDGQKITASWNATVTQSGTTVTASNPSGHWNGTIAANGGSVSFGVQGTHTGTNTDPVDFTLNGTPCNDTSVTPSATPTRTNTSVTPTNTPTRTNTGVTPTNTPTRTNTSVTPTQTPTRTNTNVTPTRTPTRTNTNVTPTYTPSATLTQTTACQLTYAVNQWNTGFTGEVKVINNTATVIKGWTLIWYFSNGEQITGSWNIGSLGQEGNKVTVIVPASHWNGTIAANGGSVTFGFQGTHTGTVGGLSNITLNGMACPDVVR